MSKQTCLNRTRYRSILSAALMVLVSTSLATSQQFEFDKLQNVISNYTVIVDIKYEVSFGMHTNEQEGRYLGTVVSEDGLVIFNGLAFGDDGGMPSFSGFSVKTTPTRIEVSTLDGDTYEGEFLGTDRFTRIGFLQILSEDSASFTPAKFQPTTELTSGAWVALYMLLPEFITPPLAADIGMVSAIIETPEFFPLTVGFSGQQLTSVLYDERLRPVGVLGLLTDPAVASLDNAAFFESFSEPGYQLLGVVGADKLKKLIADPPRRGEIDRGWLGITLQALTTDMSEFWGLDLEGGIIVNNIVSGSPAEQAGLHVGDIIYQINGQPVEVDKQDKVSMFQREISELGPGTPVELTVLRRGPTSGDAPDGAETLSLLATLQKAPLAATEAPDLENELLEFSVREMVFTDYLFYDLDSATFNGVVVSELKQGGLAAIGGLQLGDIIQRINSRTVHEIGDVEESLADIESARDGEAIFFVWRDYKTLFVNVKTDLN